MIPYELKRDKYGLLYTDDVNLRLQYQLILDNREFENERYYQNEFYPLKSTNDYILKFSTTGFTKRERRKILEMLEILVSKQKDVPDVDFPIGYYLDQRKLQGLIIRYYQNGKSFDNILNSKDIEEIGKYYAHDEDNIHNLFMLLDDVMKLEYEMFENGIFYRDFNPGNIVLTDNKPKIIDFDPFFIRFGDKDRGLKDIMETYRLVLNEVLSNYKLSNGKILYVPKDFEDAKVFTKKLENKIRKG